MVSTSSKSSGASSLPAALLMAISHTAAAETMTTLSGDEIAP